MKKKVIECDNKFCRDMLRNECHRTPKWVAESCKVREEYRASKAMVENCHSLQQLKAEIMPILYLAVSMLRDYKREDVIILLDKLRAKLSAV